MFNCKCHGLDLCALLTHTVLYQLIRYLISLNEMPAAQIY